MTAHHPEYDGMVKRFNRTLWKHTTTFGNQLGCYFSNVLWAYKNVLHEGTGKKPLFMLFEWDVEILTEVAFAKPLSITPTVLRIIKSM